MDTMLVKLLKNLEEVEKGIEETKRRLPAHSVKPPVMIDLLNLEDKRDLLLSQIEEIRGSKQG